MSRSYVGRSHTERSHMGRSHVGRRMLVLLGIMAIFLSAVFLIGRNQLKTHHAEAADINRQNQIVALNEIAKLTEVDGTSPASQQIKELTEQIRQEETEDTTHLLTLLVILYSGSMFAILIVSLYIYIVVLRPFQRMEAYAGEIAKGNFDVELKYERHQLFGAFTWAFDHMRREIKKARNCEKEAIENNKTVIATLSHDIKTPIASIRAYAEGLEANMDSNADRRERYIRVLIRKCDEVTELTNDLFIHSISDMNMLKMELKQCDIRELLSQTVEELSGDRGDIAVIGSVEQAQVRIDPKRMCQVIENIINNARKYATPDSEDRRIQFRAQRMESEKKYQIQIRDFGPGLDEKDIPFLFDKFYRGRNAEDQPGAGLGLYIVKYVMEQMDGSAKLLNHTKRSDAQVECVSTDSGLQAGESHGLTVVLELPVYGE